MEFSDSFWYKNIFAQSSPTTGQIQSDVEFHGESYGGKQVSGLCWVQNFCTKNHEKVWKNHENSRIFEKNQHFSTLLNMFFHMTRSNIRCLSTEKTLKNPRNSAYLCLIIMVWKWRNNCSMLLLMKNWNVFRILNPFPAKYFP